MSKDKTFKRQVRARVAATGERYTTARAALQSEPVYVAGYGFRRARGGFLGQLPVTTEESGARLTVRKLLGSADGVEVELDLEGLLPRKIPPKQLPPDLRAELWLDGRVHGSGWESWSRGGTKANLRMRVPPATGQPKTATVVLSGEIGQWQVDVPLRPATAETRSPAVHPGIRDTHLGVSLELASVLFDPDRTVLRVLASVTPPILFVRSLNNIGPRRMAAQALKLHDEHGNEHTEIETGALPPHPAGREHVIVFPAVLSAAHDLHLEVPWLTVSETGDTRDFALTTAGEVLSFGRYRIRILSCGSGHGPMAELYPIDVRFEPLGSSRRRRLVAPEQAFVDGKGVAVGFRSGQEAMVDTVQLQGSPTPSTMLRFKAPRVRLNGPWLLSFKRSSA
jgi:hypothetical protein